ncbi:hypothetical protein LFT51_28325 [Mycobacterium intracellulare subsp. chimaera]|nr:hypothetical protein [Mycobacterium intracellulare]ASL12191.1 hypothetical protein MYCODSM44623_05517 [Mycobacterium intracellulare subsp. chimaera]ASL24140.1 hypothetical protein MYCOZU1_05779 [Mycobacterium intracellulare subsp. chimaera]MDM3904806.1 hypothetical protein [Mycobacterium intracellulare subsp. chimaera]MDM3932050.1 hypothetical protein [Mycobacterium intracellulare subsp. chimaera]UCN04084.1 hypothetical protein LFT51_28325 [Mycobacterium intracellulare subsp. chimaera]
MAASVRSKGFDAPVWRTATLSAPFMVQAVLAVLLIAMWLLGKWPFETHSAHAGERAWMLAAVAITTLTSLLVSAALLRSRSPRNRGLGLSLASCSVVVLAGGTIFAYMVLR